MADKEQKQDVLIEKYSDILFQQFFRLTSFLQRHKKNMRLVGIIVGVVGIVTGIFLFFAAQRREYLNHLYFQTVLQAVQYADAQGTLENLDLEDAGFLELVKQYKALLLEDSGDIGALAQYNLALLYYKLKDYDSGLVHFKAAGNKDFVFADHALLYLGHSFLNIAYLESDAQKAVESVQAAYVVYGDMFKRFPKSPSRFLALKYQAFAQELLAEEYQKLQKRNEALVAYQKSQEHYREYLQFMRRQKKYFHFTDPYVLYMPHGQPVEQINIALRRIEIALNRLKAS